MSNVIPAATPRPSGPPWTANDTVYFYGGPLSNFPTTPGLRLPFGYHGHHENDRVPVRALEHWFQACKATSRQQFDMILTCGSAQAAKHAGRHTELRPDWEQVKHQVMLCGLRGKFALEPYRSALLLTHPHPLAEDSPTDYEWGCRDAHGDYNGHHLLSINPWRTAKPLDHRCLPPPAIVLGKQEASWATPSSLPQDEISVRRPLPQSAGVPVSSPVLFGQP